jgi:hypothetical protein
MKQKRRTPPRAADDKASDARRAASTERVEGEAR